MSLATLDPAPSTLTLAPHPAAARPVPPPAPRSAIRAVPSGTEARGFALYVGIDEDAALAAGTDLGAVVRALRTLAADLVPGSESYAAVALASEGAGGRDVDVVRLALQEPAAVARQRAAAAEPEDAAASEGVVIDISRKRVAIDGRNAELTYREFELLQFLVLREGRTVERAEIIDALWDGSEDEAPGARTIDVHIRRLRAKLDGYEDIVRTVRGSGYRFDRHADVAIRWASTPSPDVF